MCDAHHGGLIHLPLLLNEALHLPSMLGHLDAPLLSVHLLQPVLLSKPLHGLPSEVIFFSLLPCQPLSLYTITAL